MKSLLAYVAILTEKSPSFEYFQTNLSSVLDKGMWIDLILLVIYVAKDSLKNFQFLKPEIKCRTLAV